MFCHALTSEPPTTHENYIRAAMCGVGKSLVVIAMSSTSLLNLSVMASLTSTTTDWAKDDNEFSVRFERFVALSEEIFPSLKEDMIGPDGANWRVGLAYLKVMNKCENARPFRAPKQAAIKHSLDHNLVLAVRAVDGLGLATMCSDGAQVCLFPLAKMGHRSYLGASSNTATPETAFSSKVLPISYTSKEWC
jgi:hypothetical protein